MLSNRDIAKYNTDEDMEESIEETGWKLVHGDVFRPPQYTRLFVAILGSGVQVSVLVFGIFGNLFSVVKCANLLIQHLQMSLV